MLVVQRVEKLTPAQRPPKLNKNFHYIPRSGPTCHYSSPKALKSSYLKLKLISITFLRGILNDLKAQKVRFKVE